MSSCVPLSSSAWRRLRHRGGRRTHPGEHALAMLSGTAAKQALSGRRHWQVAAWHGVRRGKTTEEDERRCKVLSGEASAVIAYESLCHREKQLPYSTHTVTWRLPDVRSRLLFLPNCGLGSADNAQEHATCTSCWDTTGKEEPSGHCSGDLSGGNASSSLAAPGPTAPFPCPCVICSPGGVRRRKVKRQRGMAAGLPAFAGVRPLTGCIPTST